MLEIVLIVVLLLVLFGGFRSYYGGPTPGWNNGSYGFGLVGLILVILLVWFLLGGGHHVPRF